jgi:hypothetical protein
LLVGAVLAACAAFHPGVSTFAATRPLSPQDGEAVSARPKLVFLYTDFKPKMRFSIELSRDGFEEDIHSWDMRKSWRGWTLYSDNADVEYASGATFTPTEDLAEGTWEWRITAHEGGADIPLDFVSSFMVDNTPPAEVAGLRIRPDEESGNPILSWDPVFLDINGGPETVSHYKVYRYDRRGRFLVGGNLQVVGMSETTRLLIEKPSWSPSRINYFMVTAVDQVGNETVPRRSATWVANPGQEYEKKTHVPEERGKGKTKGRRPAPLVPGSDQDLSEE